MTLTELFESVKNEDTPVMVERIVNDIDEVVCAVRFDGWQDTAAGDREVQQALRRTLYVRYKMRDSALFERAPRVHPPVLLSRRRRFQACQNSGVGWPIQWQARGDRAPGQGHEWTHG